MTKSTSEILKALAWPTYFVAFMLVVTPAVDFVTNVWPIRAGDVGWRYGSVGLLAGFILTPMFGIIFVLGAAAILEHRIVVRTVSVLNVVMAVLLIGLIIFFALDVVQVRATIPDDAQAETRSMFVVGAVKALVKYLAMAFALGWLGVAGIRATRHSDSGAPPQHSKGSDVPLVRAADQQ